MGRFLDDTLNRKIVFFTGKGGVGKSTLCYATALACHTAGKKPLVAVWDGGESEVDAHPLTKLGIDLLRLNALSCFKEYALQTVKFEKIYDTVFDNQVLRTFIQTTPGVADGVIAGKLWDVAHKGDYDLILVDLPSTGHTLSFFKSPPGLQKIFSLGTIHRHAAQIGAFFQSEKSRVDFVTLPEELPITECAMLIKEIKTILKVPYGFVWLNQLTPRFTLLPAAKMPPALLPLQAIYESRWKQDQLAKELVRQWELPVLEIRTAKAAEFTDLVSDLAAQLGDQ